MPEPAEIATPPEVFDDVWLVLAAVVWEPPLFICVVCWEEPPEPDCPEDPPDVVAEPELLPPPLPLPPPDPV